MNFTRLPIVGLLFRRKKGLQYKLDYLAEHGMLIKLERLNGDGWIAVGGGTSSFHKKPSQAICNLYNFLSYEERD